ncbi:hypothetical protein B0H63DRAFT_471813 [Podospora didyma]|uniref:Uncharacterized protein n=1 Tax=Podospora didyma TaxID=330526 RepID=A0AAE0NNR5_9PEZI|nr:hypothetical protein B0H63DRAFT_471813 [Podospora didyma]
MKLRVESALHIGWLIAGLRFPSQATVLICSNDQCPAIVTIHQTCRFFLEYVSGHLGSQILSFALGNAVAKTSSLDYFKWERASRDSS